MIHTSNENKKFQNIGCASKGCNQEGRHYLKVQFLNKIGYFCDICRTDLLKDNLVEEVQADKQRQLFWIPFGVILSVVLPSEKGTDNRITMRIFSFLRMVTILRAHLRCMSFVSY